MLPLDTKHHNWVMQGGRGEEKYGILDQVRIKQLNSNHILLKIETAGQVQWQGEKFNEEIWDPWNMNDISAQLVHLQLWRKKKQNVVIFHLHLIHLKLSNKILNWTARWMFSFRVPGITKPARLLSGNWFWTGNSVSCLNLVGGLFFNLLRFFFNLLWISHI